MNKNSSAEILNQHVFTYNTLDLRSSETISGSVLPAIPSLPEETVDYDYNTVNQLLSVTNPNLTFVYDDDGNMTQGYTLDGYVFTATYDAESQMTSLEYTDSGSIVHRTEYRYSGDGFLAIIRKFENSSLVDEIRIVRDGLLAVQERDENNAVMREYTWGLNLGGGIGGLLNLKQGGQDYAYLYDGKGNIAAVIDSSQAVVAAYRYAPFGKLLAKTGSLTQPFGFSTKRYDAQTGLIYYGHRFYGPSIAKWTTRDPLGEAGDMNLYAFVGNNPVNWVDPWGLVQANLNDPALSPLVKHPWPQAKQYFGVNQQCVALTRHFTGLPCTDCWRAGQQVVGNTIILGTAIATFDEKGRYPKGREKNSGIYLFSTNEGIVILDQWPGHKAQARLVRPGGRPQNDANAYSVITVPAGTTSSKCECGEK